MNEPCHLMNLIPTVTINVVYFFVACDKFVHMQALEIGKEIHFSNIEEDEVEICYL